MRSCNPIRLRLYDQITEEAPEYYLYQAELNLLKTHSHEIASQMGFPTLPSAQHDDQDQGQERQHEQEQERMRRIEKTGETDTGEKWGDDKVGRWNGGVNGEEGLDGEKKGKGWDIVELGAG